MHDWCLVFDGDIDWKLVIDGVAAAATVAVAVFAIWGDWFRALLAPPKVKLFLHTPEGIDVTIGGGGVSYRYYHLKAVNVSPLTVQDCRILLRGMRRRGADGQWAEVPFPVPFPFKWSGEEPGPDLVTITTERVFDFGLVPAGREALFVPGLRAQPIGLNSYVRRGEAMRYELVVDARNYTSAKSQTFEVSWDGELPVVCER